MGADISGECDGERLPLTITGKQLRGRTLGLQVPSAQVKSAILLAAASADGATVVSLPDGSRDHTERMLQNLGANLTVTKRFGQESIKMIGPWRPKPFVYDVPGDPSSAAFFAALAALHPGLTVHCPKLLLNPTRVGFFHVLERMGCSVTWDLKPSESRENRLGEVVGDVIISRSENQKLTGVHVHQNEIAKLIDEVPILAVVCSAAAGESVMEGLAELRVKESDRFARILALLSAAGITATAEGDRLCITGGQRPEGFEFNSHDHRMVMSACILATIGRTPSRIYGAQWIQTSFPLFLPALQNIKAVQL
jgi:3-phosphoshikimate 1-carboxyvinyltransferase